MTDHALSQPRSRPLAPAVRALAAAVAALFARAFGGELRRLKLRSAALGYFLDGASAGLRRRLGSWGARLPRGTFRTVGGALALLLFAAALPAAVRSFDAYMTDPARPVAAPADPAASPEFGRALLDLTRQGVAAPAAAQGEAAMAANAELPLSGDPVLAARGWRFAGTAPAARVTALQCLAQAVYYEAGFEPLDGRRAVAQVVLNRVRHPAFAKSVCGVVYEGANLRVCQFSFTCDGSLLRSPAPRAWGEAVAVAHAALNGYVHGPVGHATHYHADYVFPYWAPKLSKIAKVGAHIFYRWPGSWGLPRAFAGRYAGLESIPALMLAAAEPVDEVPPEALAEGEVLVNGAPVAAEDAEVAAAAAAPGGRVSVTIPVSAGPAGPRPEDAGRVDDSQPRLGGSQPKSWQRETAGSSGGDEFRSIWSKGLSAPAAPAGGGGAQP